MLRFEDFISSANAAHTEEQLVSVFLSTVGELGYDKMIFCLLTDHKAIGLDAGVGHLRNYPKDWMDYYFSQGYEAIDPVISYCYQKLGTFSWQEMSQRMELTSVQKKCLFGGIESGLNNGVCTPVWGGNRFAGIGLASTEKKDAVHENLDLITAYCNHFYIAFQRLHEAKRASNDLTLPNIFLKPREREILLWASKGKTDGEIADLITVSYDTVRHYMKSINRKLETNNRTLAIAKAISLGLICP